jgi:methionyl-tRNA formyltransferase
MSIVFIGTPEFAVPSLRALSDAGHDISAVITQPDQRAGRGRRLTAPPVKVLAEELGIPVFQPETLRDRGAIAHLTALAPEVIVLVAYGQILRQEVLDIPPRGVLNVHASLLPRHRGASPIAGAILAGDSETGVTIMLMDAGMDTGPIISQKKLKLTGDETTGDLTKSLSELGAELLIDTLPKYLAKKLRSKPQDNSQATTTRLIKKEDGVIDWSLPAEDIARRVRAYNPWPGTSTTLNGQPLAILRAYASPGDSDEPPGTVVVPPPDVIEPVVAVQTCEGLLLIEELQRAGKKPLQAAAFLRGMSALTGQRLGGLQVVTEDEEPTSS